MDFFTYPYALLEVPGNLEGVRIASLLDNSLMKIIAISHHGKMRDFVDLYFLCQEKFTLIDLLKSIPRKYPNVTYPSYLLLRSLVYFTDAEEDVPLRVLQENCENPADVCDIRKLRDAAKTVPIGMLPDGTIAGQAREEIGLCYFMAHWEVASETGIDRDNCNFSRRGG